MSFMRVAPERVGELKQRIQEGRVEFSNGFFLEPTISLSGGEALVRMGVLGLDWYQQVFGFRPRHCWMIDIVERTGNCRKWWRGWAWTRSSSAVTIDPQERVLVGGAGRNRQLAVTDIRYAEMRPIFVAEKPFTDKDYADVAERVELKRKYSASASSVLTLVGARTTASRHCGSPSQANSSRLEDALSGHQLPVQHSEQLCGRATGRDQVRQDRLARVRRRHRPELERILDQHAASEAAYRHSEQLLAAAEMFSTAASLKRRTAYPSQDFYNSWVQMLLNMDRNTLWGAAVGMVFKDPNHWDAFDRFGSVDKQPANRLIARWRSWEAKAPASFSPTRSTGGATIRCV
jgi:hypothetical protein